MYDQIANVSTQLKSLARGHVVINSNVMKRCGWCQGTAVLLRTATTTTATATAAAAAPAVQSSAVVCTLLAATKVLASEICVDRFVLDNLSQRFVCTLSHFVSFRRLIHIFIFLSFIVWVKVYKFQKLGKFLFCFQSDFCHTCNIKNSLNAPIQRADRVTLSVANASEIRCARIS